MTTQLEVHLNVGDSALLKCSYCLLEFKQEDEYKRHYRSDFHRYNLKRKSVNLPAATFEQFQAKKNADVVVSPIAKTWTCPTCKKSFGTEATYNQHLRSKKHGEIRPQAAPKELASEATTSKATRQNDQMDCLFCPVRSQALAKNLVHMRQAHTFYIPEQTYCRDVQNLILYLQEKINVGMMCIYCENKGRDFPDGEAVRNHMKSKSHCFMRTQDGYEEYQKYYDFSALFKEKLEEQKQYKWVAGLQQQEVEVQNEENEWSDIEEEDAEEWEDEEEQVSENKQEEQPKPKNVPQPKTTKYLLYKPTLTENGELLLPNGKLLGHRKYRHLYRQYYRPIVKQVRRGICASTQESRQLVVQQLQVQNIRDERSWNRIRRLNEWNGLRLKLNQNRLQYHFRVQNPK